jgi:hypothetical protein
MEKNIIVPTTKVTITNTKPQRCNLHAYSSILKILEN